MDANGQHLGAHVSLIALMTNPSPGNSKSVSDPCNVIFASSYVSWDKDSIRDLREAVFEIIGTLTSGSLDPYKSRC